MSGSKEMSTTSKNIIVNELVLPVLGELTELYDLQRNAVIQAADAGNTRTAVEVLGKVVKNIQEMHGIIAYGEDLLRKKT